MHWYCITFACTFSANIALHMLAYTKVYETTDRAAKAGRSTLMEHCTCWLIPKSTKQQMGLAKQDDLPLWSTRKVNLNFNASSLCEVHFFFFFYLVVLGHVPLSLQFGICSFIWWMCRERVAFIVCGEYHSHGCDTQAVTSDNMNWLSRFRKII